MESSTTDVAMSDSSAEIQAESATDHVALDDLCQIQHKLLVAITTSSQKESLLSDIGRVLSDFVKPHAVQYFHRDENGGLTLAWQALSRGSEGQWKGIDKQLRASCDTACERGHPYMCRVNGVDGYLVVSVPVVHRKQAPEAVTPAFAGMTVLAALPNSVSMWIPLWIWISLACVLKNNNRDKFEAARRVSWPGRARIAIGWWVAHGPMLLRWGIWGGRS